MKLIAIAALIGMSVYTADAQDKPTIPQTQPFGKIDQADLELKACDFEKDANAEILFDYGVMDNKSGLPMTRHTRIKIFNESGKMYGNVELEYPNYNGYETGIGNIKGETINLENGKLEITPLDKKDIYNQRVDKWHSLIRFAMPNVKAGSVIDITYGQFIPAVWRFQNFIPTRYSEYELNLSGNPNFKSIPHVSQPYVKSKGETVDSYQIRAMANIHSMQDEPYMGSWQDNLQRVEFIGIDTRVSTWSKIGQVLMKANDFGYDLNRNLSGESGILTKAKSLKSADEKIAFIFDTVKNRMRWDQNLNFYTIDGTVKSWDQMKGNSAEINMMLYHLLKKAGINASPVLVSTKKHGKINPANASIYGFNNTVIYVPVDSTKSYILDATNKHALYNTMPEEVSNTFGLNIDTHDASSISYGDNLKAYNMMFIADNEPAMQSIYLNADIKAEGKMEGSAEITSSKYNKVRALQLYDDRGEAKYLDTFKNFNNDLKVLSFKRENVAVDSLPLTQKVDFSLDLVGSDANYLYVNTPFFNVFGKNPFYREERLSDIDLGYLNNYSVYAIYKLPAGYKTDALPKPTTLLMSDKSAMFKSTVVEDNGTIMIKYVLVRNKSLYFKEQYPEIHEFYKKMYELLNQPIVLKKG